MQEHQFKNLWNYFDNYETLKKTSKSKKFIAFQVVQGRTLTNVKAGHQVRWHVDTTTCDS
jgi:hypothetical protein